MQTITNSMLRTLGLSMAALVVLALPLVMAPKAHADSLDTWGDYYPTDTSSYGDYYPTDTSGWTDTGYYSTPSYDNSGWSDTGYYTPSYDTGSYGCSSCSTGSYPSYSYPSSYGCSSCSMPFSGYGYGYVPSSAPSNTNVNTNQVTSVNDNTCTGNSCNTTISTPINAPTTVTITNPNNNSTPSYQPIYQPVYQQPIQQPIYTATPIYNNPPVAYNHPAPYVSLSQVPYTGLDLGPVGTALYWGFLALWCLGAAYLIAVKRVQNTIVAKLFGTKKVAHAAHATTVTHSTHAPAPKAAAPAKTSQFGNIDPFIASQLQKIA